MNLSISGFVKNFASISASMSLVSCFSRKILSWSTFSCARRKIVSLCFASPRPLLDTDPIAAVASTLAANCSSDSNPLPKIVVRKFQLSKSPTSRTLLLQNLWRSLPVLCTNGPTCEDQSSRDLQSSISWSANTLHGLRHTIHSVPFLDPGSRSFVLDVVAISRTLQSAPTALHGASLGLAFL
jgi:hypothetical protein